MPSPAPPEPSPRRRGFRWRFGLAMVPAVSLLALACWVFTLVACKAPGHR
jgi:hypothetical protein